MVAKIIEKERPDAVLPTMGGQTAFNTALALFEDGTLEKYGVQMIGADADAIDKAEDRQRFREAMDKIGWNRPVRASPIRSRKPLPCWNAPACLRSSVPPLRWAARAAACL
jgi:carbamoylphosphate synthase large subunit